MTVFLSDYDEISAECDRILNSQLSENDKQNLDAIFAAGGSSGGARPKIFSMIDDEDWIIKFPSNLDYNTLWLLSPAYDLTWSNSIGGEHATTISGEGKNPALGNILAVAQKNGIKKSKAIEIADSVKEIVNKQLAEWIK